MSKILINGDFLCRRLTGIERYAYEITLRLDTLILPGEVAIIVPANTLNVPPYKNLEIIRHKKSIGSHLWWQMITLQFFLVTHKQYTVLEFGNTCLPLTPGIVFLHDIYCEFFPEDFLSLRDKIIRLYNRWQYRLIAKRAKRIVTVSNFSKNQIKETLGVSSDKIDVIYNGWEHFNNINSDYSILNAHPELKVTEFYFTLGSLSKRKNLVWIMKYALKHPAILFVVSGESLPTCTVSELASIASLPNLIFLGYITDAQVKSFMQKCKAFIFPSYYEGFGIPPLEALSCGTQIVIANAASLPEIYGNTAHYIDPFNTDIDLDKLLRESVELPSFVLEKYSYNKAAQQTYDIIKGISC